MKIKTISHLALQVKDMPAMLRFYREALGFQQVCDLTYDYVLDSLREHIPFTHGTEKDNLKAVEKSFADKAGKPWFIYLRMTENQLLELFYADESYDPACNRNSSYRHMSLEVENIEDAKRDLLTAGVELKTDIYMGPDKTKTLWIVDPEGNEIEFMEYTPDSLQLQ